MISFEEYLKQKKINESAWKKTNPAQWEQMKTLFELLHPDSFTAQKKFLINDLRKLYPPASDQTEERQSDE